MKRLLIDATSTIETGLNTGIQRVVRNICRHVTENALEDDVECQIIAFDGSGFQLIQDLSFITNNQTYLLNLLKKVKAKVVPVLPKFIRPIFKRLYRRTKLGKSAPRWTPAKGDVLLLADATWNYQPWNAIREARQANVKIMHIVYDLLPLKHPDLFVPELVAEFVSWWKISGYYIDAHLCISESVAEDVRHLLPETAKLGVQATSFPLGNDFTPVKIDDKRKTELIPAAEGPLFLMVGTLEPRKNHAFVMDAFDKLWLRGDNNIRLLIVGRKGWHSEQITRRIRSHPEFGGALLWLDDCNDADLEICYQSADALIAASTDEGYGLPIIEAEARGVPVLANDIKVFREVANDSVQFFKLTEVEQLVDRLRQFDIKKVPVDIAEINSMTWKASGEHLYNLIKSSLKN